MSKPHEETTPVPVAGPRRFAIEQLEDRITPTMAAMFPWCHHRHNAQTSYFSFQSQSQSFSFSASISITNGTVVVRSAAVL